MEFGMIKYPKFVQKFEPLVKLENFYSVMVNITEHGDQLGYATNHFYGYQIKNRMTKSQKKTNRFLIF